MYGHIYFTNDFREITQYINNDKVRIFILDDDSERYSKLDPNTGRAYMDFNVKMLSVLLPGIHSVEKYINNDFRTAYDEYAMYLFNDQIVNNVIALIYTLILSERDVIFFAPIDNKMIEDFLLNCFFAYFKSVLGTTVGTRYDENAHMLVLGNAINDFENNAYAKARILDIVYFFNDNFPFEKYCVEFPIEFIPPNKLVINKISILTGITPELLMAKFNVSREEAFKMLPMQIINYIAAMKGKYLSQAFGVDRTKTIPFTVIDKKGEQNK